MDTKALENRIANKESVDYRKHLPFCIATASVTELDRPLSVALGKFLYSQLTRDPQNPLTFGAGIPVAIDVIDQWCDAETSLSNLADHILLVLVAGTDSVLVRSDATIPQLINLAAKEGSPNVVKLLASSDPRWKLENQRLGNNVKVAETLASRSSFEALLGEILIAARDQLLQLSQKTTESKSVSKAESTTEPTTLSKSWPKPHLLLSDRIYQLVSRQNIGPLRRPDSGEISQYFESIRLSCEHSWKTIPSCNGLSLPAILMSDRFISGGTDQFSGRETIVAVQHGWPIVNYLVQTGETFSTNHLLITAAVEHLRQLHFKATAQRLIEQAELAENTMIICRSPQLLDFTSGVLRKLESRVLLHPDPVLMPELREALNAVAPRVSFLTPSTLLARNSKAASRLTTPLDGVRVGISASSIHSDDFTKGWTELHLEDAIVQIVRNLLSGGCSLSYGGDFRFRETTSFTPILARLTEAYRQTMERQISSTKTEDSDSELARLTINQRLNIFQPADGKLDQIPPDVVCRVRHLGLSEDLKANSIFTADEVEQLPEGMKYSAMRKVMNVHCDARIAIGGNSLPRDHNREGYGGRFPGIAEEVCRALNADQPVYLCGGFGGITKRIARLMEFPNSIDRFWNDASHTKNLRFNELKYKYDEHPKCKELELPDSLESLARCIARTSEYFGVHDDMWQDFNGLTLNENRLLWNSTDPFLLSALISRGLTTWRSRHIRASSKLRIEAVKGDIAQISGVDMLALPVVADVAPQGAGASIDRVTGGLLSRAQGMPGQLIGVRSDALDVDYLYAVLLGKSDQQKVDLLESIRSRTREVAEKCSLEGFQSLAIVTLGGSLLEKYEAAVHAMLDGFESRKCDFIIKWVEYQPDRFNELVDILQNHKQVELSTVVSTAPQADRSAMKYPWFNLAVNLDQEKLEIGCLPQDSGGVVWTQTGTLSDEELNELSSGSGPTGNGTPSQKELALRGIRLARILFGDQLESFRENFQNSPLAITHNANASKIPFELLQLTDAPPKDSAPAVNGGIHRWLKVTGVRFSEVAPRPKYSPILRVGLVIDPRGDLAGAREEGHAVERVLKALPENTRVIALGDGHGPATKEKVLEMLSQVDVLHYCGHAAFNEKKRENSALVLMEDERLTAVDLQNLPTVPRVVIFNACQAGRVRGQPPARKDHLSFSLAEVFLRAGVEAFVGTYWEVVDTSAQTFAASLYDGLASGKSLRESVTQARQKLVQEDDKDWANYILYGDGRFRLT